MVARIPQEIRDIPDVRERAQAIKDWRASQEGNQGAGASRTPGPKDTPLVDSVPEDAAPKRRGRKPATSKTENDVPYREGMYVEPVMQMYTMIGMVLSPFDRHTVRKIENGQEVTEVKPLCSQAIVANAHNAAMAWDKAAKKDPAIRKALATLTKGSVWGGIAMAHAPIVMTIVANHFPGIMGNHDAA